MRTSVAKRHDDTPGRGSPNKAPFISALACNDAGHPISLRMGKVAGFRKTEAERFAKCDFDPDAIVLSDGFACFRGFASAGFEHQPVVTGGGHRSMEVPECQRLNTVLGNVNSAMQGTYHKARGRLLPRYLGEFCYRFNCRFNLAAMLPRLGWAAVRTQPMPGRVLVLAEPSQ
jgi:hypothetical protein